MPRVVPWYKQAWPWFLITLPALAVVGSAITVWLAIRSADGVVATDYYKRGLAINRELSRLQRAAELGLRAEVEVAGFATGDRVRVHLAADRPLPPDTALKVSFIHPGRAGADRAALLGRVAGSADRADFAGEIGEAAEAVQPVAWQVVIESPSWRLDGRMDTRRGHGFRIEAAP
jgi:hypothetical protein